MNTSKQFEVAIIGGGIAGLSLAIALHQRQVPITVYEQASRFGEIGAGVSFSPNAVEAMKICHEGIFEAFEKVRTTNSWPSKQKVWFDYLDGYSKDLTQSEHQEAAFTISNSIGQNGVHRAHFLDELVKLLPSDVARFGKRLRTVEENSEGRLVMHFEDNTTAEADVVIGCDGIKSRVRQIMFGDDHPCAQPSYTKKYAYRGLIPMDKAVQAVGEERGRNSCMYMGYGGHLLTFPINHGQTLNVVAFHTTTGDWPDSRKLTRPATRDDVLKDFHDFGPNVLALLNLTQPDLDCWAIFDLGENPVPSFNRGRLCLVGDAAHATSPHHGAGAGFCIEDSAVMATLLADEKVVTKEDLADVLAAFDTNRRERSQWLVQSSRRIGDTYEWRADGIGDDLKKCEAEINRRNSIIADVDVGQFCEDARGEFRRLLAERSGETVQA